MSWSPGPALGGIYYNRIIGQPRFKTIHTHTHTINDLQFDTHEIGQCHTEKISKCYDFDVV